MPKLLFISSNPDDNIKLRMDLEFKEIIKAISPLVSHDFEFIQVPAIGIEELPGIIVKERPNILHFSGHGDERKLSFEKDGKTQYVSEEAIADIFQEVGKYVNCMLINACDSYDIAVGLSKFVPYIISFPDKIEDELVAPFSRTFYEMLSLGETIESAFNVAKAVIRSVIAETERLPQLVTNKTLSHHKATVFDQPYISVNFNLEDDAPIRKNGLYSLQFVVKNLPTNASYILYELIDQSIHEDYRFNLVTDLSAGNYFNYMLYGNVVVKAWIWLGNKKYGIGIESTLSDGLYKYYGDQVPGNCLKAYQKVTSN